MYLRTPKRYRRGRRRAGVSLSRLLIWIIVPVLIVVGIGVYENREMFTDDINRIVEGVADDVSTGIENVNAPPPTATPNPGPELERAQIAWGRGAVDEAVGIYTSLIDNLPNDISAHFLLSYGLIMAGQFDDAYTAAENAITADPFSPHGWTIRAMALNRLERYGEAFASTTHAISLIPDEPGWEAARARALAFQAEALLNLGLGERALSTAEEAITADPESAEAYYARGRVNQLYNFDVAAARNDYAEAYTLQPNLLYTGIWLARIEWLNFDNADRALELYQTMGETNPSNPQLLAELSIYYYRTGDYSRAAEQAGRCAEVNSEYDTCLWFLGRSLWQLEDYAGALSPLQEAVRLDPQDPYYRYWLAQAHITDPGGSGCPAAAQHIQIGIQVGEEQNDTGVVADLEALGSTCGIVTIPGPGAEATPEATPEITEPGDPA